MNHRVYMRPSLTNTISANLLLCIKYTYMKHIINQFSCILDITVKLSTILKTFPSFIFTFQTVHSVHLLDDR
jgi:hypothetical protein